MSTINFHHIDNMEFICVNCEKEFKVQPYRVKRGNVKFCSDKCKHDFQRGRNHPKWNNGIITFNCIQCNKSVTKKRNKDNKFCSVSCSVKYYNPLLRPRRIYTKKCKVCGNVITGSKSYILKAKYCSIECMSKDYKIIQSGSANNNFKDGLYTGLNSINSVRKMRVQIAKSIKTHTEQEWIELLIKCNHRCVNCGSTSNIEKDHIIPISRGGHDGIDNIQPLCKKCNIKKFTNTFRYASY